MHTCTNYRWIKFKKWTKNTTSISKKTFNFNSRIAGYGFAIFQKITFARYTCKRIRKALDLGFNKKGAKLSSEFFICRLFLQHVTISVWTLQKMLGRTPVQQLITTTVRGGFCLARHIWFSDNLIKYL